MFRSRRVDSMLAALVCSQGLLFGQEPIENWAAPPFWSPQARVAPEGRQVSPLGAEAVEGLPTLPIPFHAITPCRLVDTRPTSGFSGAYGPPALVANATRDFDLNSAPHCPGIPANAEAYSLNVTVTETLGFGDIRIWPTGAFAVVSTQNWQAAGVTLANAAVIAAGTGGSITVQAAGSGTHLIIDINGYYAGSVVTSVTAGTGLAGGGTGAVTVGIAAGGVGSTELATGAVTSTKIGANAVTAGAIATGQVVKSLNGLTDTVSLVGSGGTTVTPGVGTITIGSSGGGGAAPAGSFILGNPGDSTIIGAGYTEIGSSNVDLWSATATSGAPTARQDHTAVWTGTKMIVWGGTPDNIVVLNTGGQYDPATDSWTATTTTGAPAERRYHTAVWTGSKMIVWGGANANTGGQYDPVANSWTATTTTNAPDGRSFHTAVWTGSLMIVWGGNPFNPTSGGRYDPIGNSWTATTTTNAPTARWLHTAIWTGTKMIIWGGFNGVSTYYNTGALYDPADSWTATTTTGAPVARSLHTAVWTGSRMIVWGGAEGAAIYNTGGQYDPVGDSWAFTTTTGAPTGRNTHTAIWTGSRMVVWGGNITGMAFQNTGGQFDPASGSWAVGGTNTMGAPSGRSSHTAVWTGTQMIVWGGNTAGLVRVNTGGRYRILSLYVKN